MLRRILACLLCFTLLFEQSGFAQSVAEGNFLGFFAPPHLSGAFNPARLRYVAYAENINKFKFLFDKGDLRDTDDFTLKDSISGPLSYFLVGITLPSESFWVNLRPDSPANVIDDLLAETDVGKIFLEADLQLKKEFARYTMSAQQGKEYRLQIRKKAEELFGCLALAPSTFTRVWIDPGEIIIRETQNSAYIYKANLNVLTEEDYFGNSLASEDKRVQAFNEYASELIKNLILPKLIKEVNTGKEFAALRQVYYSFILAQWFKNRFLQRNGPAPRFIDSKILSGLNSKHPWSKEDYFAQYQESVQRGDYRFDEREPLVFGEMVTSYSCGGVTLALKIPPFASAGMITSDGSMTLIGGREIEGILSPDRVLDLGLISATAKFDLKDPLGNVIVESAASSVRNAASAAPVSAASSAQAMNDGGSQVLKKAKEKLSVLELNNPAYLIAAELLLGALFIFGFFVDAGSMFYNYGVFGHSVIERFVGYPLPSLNEYFQIISLSFIAFNALFGLSKSPAVRAKTGLAPIFSILSGFTLFGIVPLAISLTGLDKYFNLQLAVSPYAMEAFALLGAAVIGLLPGMNTKKESPVDFPESSPDIENNTGWVEPSWDAVVEAALNEVNKRAGISGLTDGACLEFLEQTRKLRNLLPFESHIVTDKRVAYYQIYDEALQSLCKKLQEIMDRLRVSTDELERKRLNIYASEILVTAEYFNECLRALNEVENIPLSSGDRLDRSTPFRKTISFIVGHAFGFNKTFNYSKKELMKQLKEKIIPLGNSLDNLYSTKADIDKQVIKKWGEWIQNCYEGKRKRLGARKGWVFWKEMFGPLVSLVLVASALPIGGNIGFLEFLSAPDFSAGALWNAKPLVGLSLIFLGWYVLLFPGRGKADQTYKEHNKTIEKLKRQFKDTFFLIEGDSRNKALQFAYEQSLEAAWKELSSASASAQAVIVVTEQPKIIQDFLENLRGTILRKDVELLAISAENKGSAAAFIEGMLEARKFKRSILLLGREQDIARSLQLLPLPAFEPLGRPLTPLELSLINGYQLTQALKQKGRWGTAVEVTHKCLIRDLNSSLEEVPDMELTTALVDIEQMARQDLALIVENNGNGGNGKPKPYGWIRKIFKHLSLEDVRNKTGPRHLPAFSVDWRNKEKRQMRVFSGEILVSIQDKERNESFMSFLSQMKDYMAEHSKDSFQPNLTTHFLVPLVMLTNNEGAGIHRFREGLNLKNKEDIFLKGLFNLFWPEDDTGYHSKLAALQIEALIPHQSSFYTRLDGTTDADAVLKQQLGGLYTEPPNKEILTLLYRAAQNEDTASMQHELDGGHSSSNVISSSPQRVVIPSLGAGVGGIGFSSMKVVLNYDDLLKIDGEWGQIEKMLESGNLPSIPSVTNYVETAVKNTDSGMQLYKAMACVAGILKLEEELVIPAQMEIKRLLLVLEEHLNRQGGQMNSKNLALR
ncbi:MAG: hypothetical protein PHP73_05735 [Candidatus Omnitrophica bacterium]|nr:hypothetical protein [Candidatus Omnitrophota bacterium]